MSKYFFSDPFAPIHIVNSIYRKEFPKALAERTRERGLAKEVDWTESEKSELSSAGAAGGGEYGRARKGVDKWPI